MLEQLRNQIRDKLNHRLSQVKETIMLSKQYCYYWIMKQILTQAPWWSSR